MNEDSLARRMSQIREMLKPGVGQVLERIDKTLPAPYGLAVQIGTDFVRLDEVAVEEHGDYSFIKRTRDGGPQEGELVHKSMLRLSLKAIVFPERETEETRENRPPATVLG